MKFRFEDQPHQASAISAVTDLFDGALTPPAGGIVGQAPGASGHTDFTLDRDVLTDQLPKSHLVKTESTSKLH